MKKVILIISTLVAVVVLAYLTCTVIVTQGETVILMDFGKPVQQISEPGIYLKLPYPFNSVERVDARLIMLQPSPAEFLTADKKNLILASAICYKITRPVLFKRTVRDQNGLEIRLTDLLSSHTGLLMGHIELSDLVNVNPGKIKFGKMNRQLTELMKRDGKSLGIVVEKVFIKRIMLPDENRYAVFQRMKAERNRIAKKYIAEGEEKAQQIKSEADRTSRIIIAEAKRKAVVMRGEAEAEAMKIYSASYHKNAEFYNFVRSLEAYEKMFNRDTVIILDEKSPVLKSFFSRAKNAGK